MVPHCSELAKRVIVIDSKGIDAGLTRDLLDHSAKNDREAQQLATEVRLMQLFIKIADCVLFLLPYSELHNIHAQLALFELSLVGSIYFSQQARISSDISRFVQSIRDSTRTA